MIQQKLELPGIDRIRLRFLQMLCDRQFAIAEHALAAWESDTVDGINSNLTSARTLFHQIAGTAGSLGSEELGEEARTCEITIDKHLESAQAEVATCPSELIFGMDDFLKISQALIEENSELINA